MVWKVDLRYSSNTRRFHELIGHWGLQAYDSTLILINWCLASFYWWSWQLLCTRFLGHRFGLCLLLINVHNPAKLGKNLEIRIVWGQRWGCVALDSGTLMMHSGVSWFKSNIEDRWGIQAQISLVYFCIDNWVVEFFLITLTSKRNFECCNLLQWLDLDAKKNSSLANHRVDPGCLYIQWKLATKYHVKFFHSLWCLLFNSLTSYVAYIWHVLLNNSNSG